MIRIFLIMLCLGIILSFYYIHIKEKDKEIVEYEIKN